MGNNYKTPRFPIWVVGSSSHYTFCFALNKGVGQVSEVEALEQQTRAVFNELDPNEEGFIKKEQVKSLLTKLKLPDSAAAVDAATTAMDPNGLGLVLWNNVLPALTVSALCMVLKCCTEG